MYNISFYAQYSKRYKGWKLPEVLEIGKQQQNSAHQTKLVLVVTLDGNVLIAAILGRMLNFHK